MRDDPTYEELAEFIARYVYDVLYYEVREHGTSIWIVNHLFSSTYEITVRVLTRLDILDPLDEDELRTVFKVTPDEFAAVIARNKDKGCSYGILMLALVCLLRNEEDLTQPGGPTGLREYCIEIGLFEPLEPPALELTDKGRAFDALYADWDRHLDD